MPQIAVTRASAIHCRAWPEVWNCSLHRTAQRRTSRNFNDQLGLFGMPGINVSVRVGLIAIVRLGATAQSRREATQDTRHGWPRRISYFTQLENWISASIQTPPQATNSEIFTERITGIHQHKCDNAPEAGVIARCFRWGPEAQLIVTGAPSSSVCDQAGKRCGSLKTIFTPQARRVSARADKGAMGRCM